MQCAKEITPEGLNIGSTVRTCNPQTNYEFLNSLVETAIRTDYPDSS